MMSEETCRSWVRRVSYVLLADAISRPSTSAAMVAIKAIPSLTTSCVSELRCFLGTIARKNMPSSAPVKTHPNTMHAIATELSIYPQAVEWWPTRAEYRGGRARRQAAAVGRLASAALDRENVSSVVSAQRYDRHRTTLLEVLDAYRAAHPVIAKTLAPRPNGGAGRSLAGVALGRVQGEMERGPA